MAEAAAADAERLAKLAAEETGFGKWEDKKQKNLFAAQTVYNAIKDLKTVGIVDTDEQRKVLSIAIPVGVIAALIPSTNPTSTVIYKALIAVKSGNPIVFSPHPKALNCIVEAMKTVFTAAHEAGLPDGAISCITIPTMEATQELMRHKYTSLILATGGPGMVKAAYSSGTPAIGVGAGNGPAFIDQSANVEDAIRRIVASKTFDNGTICASEQSIIIEKALEQRVVAALKNNGAYMLSEQESAQLAKILFRPGGALNPAIVGKPAAQVAKLAGITVPAQTRILIARESGVGASAPYSMEKLAPVLALYVENSVDEILNKCIQILSFEGIGHSFMMHCNDDALVKRFAAVIPASRILINTAGSLGGIGATTGLFPALTLGCGAMGGSSSSNNIGPLDLLNIKRVAYGVREPEELTGAAGAISNNMIEQIVNAVMKQLI